MSNSHIHNFWPYSTFNSSIIMIVLSLSCDCPSFEWFFPSACTSKCVPEIIICCFEPSYALTQSRPPLRTERILYCVESLCVHFMQVLHAINIVSCLLLHYHLASVLNLMLMTVTRYNSKVSLPRMWICNA